MTALLRCQPTSLTDWINSSVWGERANTGDDLTDHSLVEGVGLIFHKLDLLTVSEGDLRGTAAKAVCDPKTKRNLSFHLNIQTLFKCAQWYVTYTHTCDASAPLKWALWDHPGRIWQIWSRSWASLWPSWKGKQRVCSFSAPPAAFGKTAARRGQNMIDCVSFAGYSLLLQSQKTSRKVMFAKGDNILN